jgi:hypothetical protein
MGNVRSNFLSVEVTARLRTKALAREEELPKPPAWSKWPRRGRIGMVMPEPAKSPITVDIDFIKLEKTSRNN